jgi:hypothetical protein
MKGYLQSLPVVGKIFLDVQPEEVWAFWRFMQDHFRTSVINKNSALEMQLVARGLEALGRRIYTPFEVGSPKGGWDLWHQIVICVHEHQHVVQHDREGLAYEVSYLADRAARARWEAEAYRSNLEMQFWRTGTTPSAQATASVLKDYGCRDEDIEVTAKSLALSAISVKKGAIINEATHVALGWLDEHLPRLRFKQG